MPFLDIEWFFSAFWETILSGAGRIVFCVSTVQFWTKKTLKSLFFFISKLSGKNSAYCCQFLAPVFKSAGESFEEKYTLKEKCISSWFLGIKQKSFSPCFCFFSELSNLHSTCTAKSFQKFFSNEITFFILFGHWAQILWLSVTLFPVGLSQLLSSCP